MKKRKVTDYLNLDSERKVINEELFAKIRDLTIAVCNCYEHESLTKKLETAKKNYIEEKEKFEKRRTKKQYWESIKAYARCRAIEKEISEINLQKVKLKLENYENFIDKKYWNLSSLFRINSFVYFGEAQTIEKAIELFEKENHQ